MPTDEELNNMSDDEFNLAIFNRIGVAGKKERGKILEDVMENGGENSKRFNAKFDRARNNIPDRGFRRVRGELKAQEDFITFGTKINPAEREGGMALPRGVKRKFAKDGFRGNIFDPTEFTVGEKGKKEHVKKNNNIFDVGFKF